MILSMTGYGRGEANTGTRKISVEFRSINSRYLEVSLRMPPALQLFELEVREVVRKRLGRGKLSISVSESSADGAPVALELNLPTVTNFANQLREIAKATKLEGPTLRDVLYFHDMLVGDRDEAVVEEKKGALLTAVNNAITSLEQMRGEEGKALATDLEDNLKQVDNFLNEVEVLAKGNSAAQRVKLDNRLSEAGLSPSLIDPQRLTAEVALLVDRQDISEEIVRLRSHVELFRQTMNSTGTGGKRLNFLTQEMHREANTIASKAGLVEIVHLSVKLREVIEILREQVQNVE